MSNNSISNDIELCLRTLVGIRLRRIRRMAATVCIGFGDLIKKDTNRKSLVVEVPKYAMHIECAFRIVSESDIILGNLDIFSENSKTQWSESFDWDVSGANLFDEKTTAITTLASTVEITILNVQATSFGDLEILLSNGWTIQVFINDSSSYEAWSFFENRVDAGCFIVTGQGIGE